MAWDIYIQDLPDVKSVKDLPPDFRLNPIGTREQLIERVRVAVPFAEKQDGWLFVRRPGIDISIAFEMEDAEHVRYIVVHVHGGDQSATCVAGIVRHLGLRALDTATGEFFDTASLDESL
ncbi:MAG: hypothetical protein ABI599_14830 [Flavobacteriales bacterium]